MNSTTPPIEVIIPQTIVETNPELAHAMREASDYFYEGLDYTFLESQTIPTRLLWRLDKSGEKPRVVVDCRFGLPSYSGDLSQELAVVQQIPVSQFADPFGQHDLIYRVLHAVNSMRIKRSIKHVNENVKPNRRRGGASWPAQRSRNSFVKRAVTFRFCKRSSTIWLNESKRSNTFPSAID